MWISLFVNELLKVIVDAFGIAIREDFLNKNDHIVVVDEEDKLSISIFFNLGKIVLFFFPVKCNFIFYEINNFNKAAFHIS